MCVVCCAMSVVCCFRFACLSAVGCWLALLAFCVCCVLLGAYCFMFVGCCLMILVCCAMFVVCCLVCVGLCVLPCCYCLLFFVRDTTRGVFVLFVVSLACCLVSVAYWLCGWCLFF